MTNELEAIFKNQPVLAGFVVKAPIYVIAELRALLKQSANTQIFYCAVSTEQKAFMFLKCDPPQVTVLDAGNGKA